MDFLLDTNICIFHLRGKIDLNKMKIDKDAKFFISEISILELYYGAEKSDNKVRSFDAVEKLLEEFEIISIKNTATKYADEKNYLYKNGTPLHNEFDLLIGITAVNHNKILVTDNFKDFKNIRNLQLENWIQR